MKGLFKFRSFAGHRFFRSVLWTVLLMSCLGVLSAAEGKSQVVLSPFSNQLTFLSSASSITLSSTSQTVTYTVTANHPVKNLRKPVITTAIPSYAVASVNGGTCTNATLLSKQTCQFSVSLTKGSGQAGTGNSFSLRVGLSSANGASSQSLAPGVIVSAETSAQAPSITGISPNPANGLSAGTIVNITGKNFTGIKSVTIGTSTSFETLTEDTSANCNQTQPNATSGHYCVLGNGTGIKANPGSAVPSGSSVTITTAGGSTSSNSSLPVAAPSITGVSPNPANGVSAGTIVSVTGNNLSGTTGVTIGTGSSSQTLTQDTSANCDQTQPNVTSGHYCMLSNGTGIEANPSSTVPSGSSITITTAGGSTSSNSSTPVAGPSISGISPNPDGGVNAGTLVNVTGNNFNGVTDVTIGTGSSGETLTQDTSTNCNQTQPTVTSGHYCIIGDGTGMQINPGSTVPSGSSVTITTAGGSTSSNSGTSVDYCLSVKGIF